MIRAFPIRYSFRVFASVECHYCKLLVPHFWKTIENLQVTTDFIAWESYSDHELNEIVDRYGLLALPTIIVYALDGSELGRIIRESRSGRLEQDLVDIVRK